MGYILKYLSRQLSEPPTNTTLRSRPIIKTYAGMLLMYIRMLYLTGIPLQNPSSAGISGGVALILKKKSPFRSLCG